MVWGVLTPNEERADFIKNAISLEYYGLVIKLVRETIENETKKASVSWYVVKYFR